MIKKIPVEKYIDIDRTEVGMCEICQCLNTIPCEHNTPIFRKRDRIDNLIDTINEIVDYLNANTSR